MNATGAARFTVRWFVATVALTVLWEVLRAAVWVLGNDARGGRL